MLVAGEIELDGFVAFEPETREIRALYVAPDRFRQGVGTELIEAAHDELNGDTALWVFEGNDRAFAFYARHGYTRDGASTVHESTGRHRGAHDPPDPGVTSRPAWATPSTRARPASRTTSTSCARSST